MNLFNDSAEVKQALRDMVKEVVAEETKSTLRAYKAKVIAAPNSTTKKCVVRLVGDSTSLSLPYSSDASSVKAGDIVWVLVLFNSMRNAIVWQNSDFSL